MSTPPDLTTDPIGRSLLRMTGPMTVGLLANMLFNLVDTYFVGKLGQQELAAMAFTFPLVFFVTGTSMGLSIGVSSVVSRAIGAGNPERVQRLTTHSLLLGTVVVAVLLGLALPFLNPVLRAMGADEAMIPLVRSYMMPWATGIVFIVVPMLGNSVIRATGDTTVPSAVMLIAGGLNVLLDPILIFGFGPVPALELAGAAWATVISYLVVFVVMFLLLRFKYHLLVFRIGSFRDVLASWGQVLHIGIPAAFTNQLIPVANGVITAMIAGYGEPTVAAWGVSTRLESLMMSPFFALSTVMSSFVGQNTGAQKPERITRALRFCGNFCMSGTLLIWIICALGSGWIAGLFSQESEVQHIIALHLWIVPATYGSFAWKLQYTSSFNAQGHPLYSSAAFLARFFLFRIPLAWMGSHFYAITGMFWGLALSNILALLFTMALWRHVQKKP
jgi:putative MATE family efflux protein